MAASPADEKKLQDFLIKIGTIVRLFASDKAGEAANSVQAFGAVLKSAGPEMINLVADRIEKGAQLTQDEVREIYDAAVAEVERKYKHAAATNGSPSFSNGHGNMPSDRVMVEWCLERIDDLTREKDQEFIRSAYARIMRWGSATPKMQPWLQDLYLRLGGRI
jgi:hypothetical protein